jgi:hypothetical protein
LYSQFLTPEGNTTFREVYNPRLEKVYRTFHGTHISHNGVIYAGCADNFNLAITRLTSCTFPTLVEDVAARARQSTFFKNDVIMRRIILEIQSRFHRMTSDRDAYDAFFEYANRPHPKRRARIYALDRLLKIGHLSHPTFVDIVTGKLKLDEWAKPGKYPRLINDYTVVGSLLGGFVAEIMKKCMEAPFHTPKGCARFVSSPNVQSLREAFGEILTPSSEISMIFFSDDSCIAVQRDGLTRRYNMDIKSADRSAHDGVFDALVECSSSNPLFMSWVLRSVKQCKLPLKMRFGKRLKLTPTEHTLYSGSVLTTLINNLANLALFSAAHQPTPIPNSFTPTGYSISLDECVVPEDLQFLKYSPSLIQGEVVPWLNIGVILRTLGNCHQDLPGRGDIRKRGFIFDSNIIKGLKHSGNHEILRTLQNVYNSDVEIDVKFVNKNLPYFNLSEVNNVPIPLSCIANRYRVEESDVSLFISDLLHHREHCLRGRFSDACMKLDYGL